MKHRHPSSPTRSSSSSRSRAENNKSSGEQMDNPLHEVFLEELADVYSAEKQLLKALPKMAKAAESDDLRTAFEEHLKETQTHAQRLEEAVESMGEKMQRKTCKAMEGLIEEADEMAAEHKGEPSIDAVLIAAAQKVEHYEIASYGTLVAWARQMGHNDAAGLLQETLAEEKAADEKLTGIAETVANTEAEAG